MTAVRNVLFVMCDQLRRDFVSCYGESPVDTPNNTRVADGCRRRTLASPGAPSSPDYSGAFSSGSFE